jgi:hypothetical protein
MSKPQIHARSSAKKYGGKETDYLELHNFMDSSKASHSDQRHRAALHNSFGCYIAEQTFGTNFSGLEQLQNKHGFSEEAVKDILQWKESCRQNGTEMVNSDGRKISIRDLAEQHILEDYRMRFIPSLSDWLGKIAWEPWMNNGHGSPPSFAFIKESQNVSS